MNVFDADVVSCRTDSGKGTNVTYGTMMANGDMYTQSVLHDEAHSSSAYDADYLRKSKPIQFEEEDCEDNTWVTILIFCECRFECLVFNQKMLAVTALWIHPRASFDSQQLHVSPFLYNLGSSEGVGFEWNPDSWELYRCHSV